MKSHKPQHLELRTRFVACGRQFLFPCKKRTLRKKIKTRVVLDLFNIIHATKIIKQNYLGVSRISLDKSRVV
jgi:hypothetical protein